MPVTGEFYCKTHEKKLKARQAAQHHKDGCEVWYVNPESGDPTHRYGEKAKEKSPAKADALKDLNRGGADIEEHFKGFKEPDDEVLFVYYKGGRIQKFWDRFGDHRSIYQALVKGKHFEGTPAEFVDASARYMLAVAGYEPVPSIIPTSERDVYEETARLIREGHLRMYYDEEGQMRLETIGENGTEESDVGDKVAKAGVSAGGDQAGLEPEGLSSREGEEKPGQPE